MRASPNRILTQVIGEELVRLLRQSPLGASLAVCQFGGVEKIANPEAFAKTLPAVIVEPDAEELFDRAPSLDVAGTNCRVTEAYRIVGFQTYRTEDNLATLAVTMAQAMLAALTVDMKLTGIAAVLFTGTHRDQVDVSEVVATEWRPAEQLPFAEAGQPVLVVALRWVVKWYSR